MIALHRLLLTAAAILAAPAAALAHHPTGSAVPANMFHGLLSGLGHPVIGPDHLVFLLAIGLLAGLTELSWRAPVALIAGGVIGVLGRSGGIDVGPEAVLVALTLVLFGVALASGAGIGRRGWLGALALAGLVHGYAYGESIVGADRPVIAAYLAGLAVSQGLLVLGVGHLAAWAQPGAGRLRAAGGALAVAGVGFLMLGLVPG